jgi:pyrroloquinoline quinone (PQQ) biosynthesis protein C
VNEAIIRNSKGHMEFFARLSEETLSEANVLRSAPIIGDALQGSVTRAQYIAFLTRAYHHVRHTVPLLMACGSRLPDRLEWLRAALSHYIQEEIGHDAWILNDAAAVGGDVAALRHGRPSLETEILVSYAYDTVTRGNPVGLFGMVYVLEGTSAMLASRVADALRHHLDLPDAALSYLKSHGSLDLQHLDDLRELLNRLDHGDDRAEVVHRAKVFFRLYGDVLRGVPSEVRQ